MVVTSPRGGREGIPREFVKGLDLNPQALAEISRFLYPGMQNWTKDVFITIEADIVC